jgi:broad specificity phosphatase PhoE
VAQHESTAHHEIVLVRHGATEWSVSGRHTGRTDVPLTEEGRAQARAVGAALDGRTFAAVFVSPMSRARETCRLAGYGDEAEVVDDLREWDYGEYEGRTTAEIRTEVPNWTVWDGDLPDGESRADLGARADRVIGRAMAVDGDVALFAHGHILRVVTARWCELAPDQGRRFLLETGTTSVLGWEHEYRGIRLWNDR